MWSSIFRKFEIIMCRSGDQTRPSKIIKLKINHSNYLGEFHASVSKSILNEFKCNSENGMHKRSRHGTGDKRAAILSLALHFQKQHWSGRLLLSSPLWAGLKKKINARPSLEEQIYWPQTNKKERERVVSMYSHWEIPINKINCYQIQESKRFKLWCVHLVRLISNRLRWFSRTGLESAQELSYRESKSYFLSGVIPWAFTTNTDTSIANFG